MLCPNCKKYKLTFHEKRVTGQCRACYAEEKFKKGETSFADLDWIRWQRQHEEVEKRIGRVISLLAFVVAPVGFIILLVIISLFI